MPALRFRTARVAFFEAREHRAAPQIRPVLAMTVLVLGGVALLGWTALLLWIGYRTLLWLMA